MRGSKAEVFLQLVTTQSKETSEAIRHVREQFSRALRQQAEAVGKVRCDSNQLSNQAVLEIKFRSDSDEERREYKYLFERPRKGVDWSYKTSGKCFSNTMAKQVDYIYEERVRQPAGKDLRLLGSGNPGPSA